MNSNPTNLHLPCDTHLALSTSHTKGMVSKMSFKIIVGISIAIAVVIMFPFFVLIPVLLLLAIGSKVN